MKPITAPLSDADFPATRDKASPGVWVALKALRAYKVLISPYFAGSCRFLPSCADYAAEAVSLHGVCRGSWLAARRLLRCHPFCAAGHDPVPTRSVSGKRKHAPGRPASRAENNHVVRIAARVARLLGARSPSFRRAPGD